MKRFILVIYMADRVDINASISAQLAVDADSSRSGNFDAVRNKPRTDRGRDLIARQFDIHAWTFRSLSNSVLYLHILYLSTQTKRSPARRMGNAPGLKAHAA